jgi:hypothetical protein
MTGWLMNDKIGKDLKRSSCDLIKVLFQYLPEKTVRNTEKSKSR